MLNWLQREIRWPGVVLASMGLAVLARARRRDLLLLGGSAATIVLFAMDYDVYDVEVFLILPMIVGGLVAGVGMQQIVLWSGRRFGAAASAIAAVVLLLVPYGQFRANIDVDNHHRHTFESELFDRLFRVLPAGSAIVAENYPVDHMVLYKLIGELVQPQNARHIADTESPSIACPLSRVVPQHPVEAPLLLISSPTDHREMTTSASWRVSP